MHIPSPGIDLNPTSLEREASGRRHRTHKTPAKWIMVMSGGTQ